MTGNPVRTIGVRRIAGAKTCGDYQRENAGPDGAEDVLFGSCRFHFKFRDWIVTDGRGLTVLLPVDGD
jgi:hypothetical protein